MKKPTKPRKPVEPSKTFTVTKSKAKVEIYNYGTFSFSGIIENLKKQLGNPAAFDLSKVKINTDWSEDYSDNYCFYDEPETIVTENKEYPKQFQKWEEDMAIYEGKMLDYETAKKQHEEYIKNEEIERAKAILKKYEN